jgi:hypothetical protein
MVKLRCFIIFLVVLMACAKKDKEAIQEKVP